MWVGLAAARSLKRCLRVSDEGISVLARSGVRLRSLSALYYWVGGARGYCSFSAWVSVPRCISGARRAFTVTQTLLYT